LPVYSAIGVPRQETFIFNVLKMHCEFVREKKSQICKSGMRWREPTFASAYNVDHQQLDAATQEKTASNQRSASRWVGLA
jgi:hypothetical protein